ncbi:hypothetical protein [Nocardia salmonicida]|uniref:hypothetical protein n=1 Tax=Nocardia salmonicida TaxID=53431 RepID=UPI0033FD385F
MGQHFKPVFLAEDSDTVTGHRDPEIFFKLVEHAARRDNWFVSDVERILTTPTRIVWVGEYADPEPGTEPPTNLHRLTDRLPETPVPDLVPGRHLINHDRRIYLLIDSTPDEDEVHPLPALTVEDGEGYLQDVYGLIGYWARQRISVADTPPAGYTEIQFRAWFD